MQPGNGGIYPVGEIPPALRTLYGKGLVVRAAPNECINREIINTLVMNQ